MNKLSRRIFITSAASAVVPATAIAALTPAPAPLSDFERLELAFAEIRELAGRLYPQWEFEQFGKEPNPANGFVLLVGCYDRSKK